MQIFRLSITAALHILLSKSSNVLVNCTALDTGKFLHLQQLSQNIMMKAKFISMTNYINAKKRKLDARLTS